MDFCFSFNVFALGTWIVIVDLQCKKPHNLKCKYYMLESLIAAELVKEVSCLTKKGEVGGKDEIVGERFEENE